MSAITCNEEIKGNAKCKKNLLLSHLLGDLGATHRVHLWLDGKRIVDFILAIIELFSIAELLSEICRNLRLLKGWVILSANFTYMGTSPAISLCIVRYREMTWLQLCS